MSSPTGTDLVRARIPLASEGADDRTPLAAGNPAAAERPTAAGRGRRAVAIWQRARDEAGLPRVPGFDGPLVSLAVALLFDRQVDAELERFRRARSAGLGPEQVELDVEIGRAAVRASGADRTRRGAAGPDDSAADRRADHADGAVITTAPTGSAAAAAGRPAGAGLLLAGTLLCRAAAGGMRGSRLPRARAAC